MLALAPALPLPALPLPLPALPLPLPLIADR